MAASASTPEQNLAKMKHFIKTVQGGGDFSQLDQIMHPDLVDHTPEGIKHLGVDGSRAVLQQIHAGFSDIKVTIIDCVASGNVVATNKIISGIHSGVLFGKPATGEKVQLPVMDFVKFEDGLFHDHWANVGPLTTVKE